MKLNHEMFLATTMIGVGILNQVRWGENRFILCHFPLESWWHAHRGVLHLHGHCHGSLPRALPHRFDVGTDVEHFLPVSAPELLRRASAQEFTPQDHHGSLPGWPGASE